eukprot:CAMPEP_0201205456 /NCGR_PEP_ID=MMETSP0851-20130426/170904_1 /ASSEMBLY_ACC=CAM_ASM_000631 /TAXON_ID=183588 /ORGANISM="Pseudo-nitzschia fraudulenta, Strain WWA7" /LENGTH=34 /DNA_ID= /DNA_START= /DNA_END= /DNA_ORIENTATION=
MDTARVSFGKVPVTWYVSFIHKPSFFGFRRQPQG